MNSENFKKINEEFFKHCIDTLNKKQIEYSEGKSVFHVFDQGAYKRRCMREDIIDAFMFKHEISIDSIQEDFKINKFPDIDTINEKFGDIINYLLIKRASFIDRVNKENLNKEKKEKYTYNEKGEKTSNTILDEKGNIIKYIDNKGYCYEKTYDDKNNVLSYKDHTGRCYEKTYNDNNNELSYKDSHGLNERYEYYENGCKIGTCELDEKGNVIKKNID